MKAIDPTEKVVVKILDLPGDTSPCPCLLPTGGPEYDVFIQQKVASLRAALEKAYPGRTRVEYLNLQENPAEQESAEAQFLATKQFSAPLVIINSEPRYGGIILVQKIVKDVGQLLGEREKGARPESGGRTACVSCPDITQVAIGRGLKVGITGLQEAIEAVRALGARPEAEITQALLDKLKPRNYIPVPALEDYKQAFLREFKKALGEQVKEEQHGMVIKILGPGCPNCHRLEQLVLEVLSEMHLPADVEHVKDAGRLAAYGVFGMPALIINNEVKVVGEVPTREALKQWLSELPA